MIIRCSMCRYSQDELGVVSADAYAVKHSLKHGHPVRVLESDEAFDHWVGENRTPPIPGWSDSVPF
jgi:hypothetical protein